MVAGQPPEASQLAVLSKAKNENSYAAGSESYLEEKEKKFKGISKTNKYNKHNQKG